MATCHDCANLSDGEYCRYYKEYPDSDWQYLRDYIRGSADATSCSGFEKKGCFLTSAVVDYMGKADDCEELTTLRAFRDGYMCSFAEGRQLVNEYYLVAPKIVSAIDASDKRAAYYSDIYQTVSTCVEKIKQGKNDETMRLYCGMVNKYKALI